MASPATSSTIIMSSTWASVVPAGKVPKDTAPPFRRPLCPSWRAGFSPTPTKSGASKASGWICGSWERRRPGPAHRGPRRTRAGGCRAGEFVGQDSIITARGVRRPGPASTATPPLVYPCLWSGGRSTTERPCYHSPAPPRRSHRSVEGDDMYSV